MKRPIKTAMFTVSLVLFAISANATDFECSRRQSVTECVKAAVGASPALANDYKELKDNERDSALDSQGKFRVHEMYVTGDGDWIFRRYLVVVPLKNAGFVRSFLFSVNLETTVNYETMRVESRTVTAIQSVYLPRR